MCWPGCEAVNALSQFDAAVQPDVDHLGDVIRGVHRTRLQMLALRGFASANKDRWAVVMPRFLPPKPGQAVGVVRMVLWVYRWGGRQGRGDAVAR